MADKKILQVKIRDTQSILFEGEADRINSYNEIGPFDIYPMHANFISIIQNKVAVYRNKEKVKELTFEQAIMKVKKDIVHIYLGIEIFYIEDAEMKPAAGQTPIQVPQNNVSNK
jgi:F0F1-type ATP synthase epsilon subunit